LSNINERANYKAHYTITTVSLSKKSHWHWSTIRNGNSKNNTYKFIHFI